MQASLCFSLAGGAANCGQGKGENPTVEPGLALPRHRIGAPKAAEHLELL